MGRISNAWALSKSSWAVLSKDRELVAIPVMAAVAAVAAFAAVALPGMAIMGGFDETSSGGLATWLIMLVAVVAASWMMAIGQAAVVAGAAERMDGGDPTISSALGVARARAGRLLEWAVLATVVSVILDQLQERLGILGSIISWVGSIAFSVLSFLALPVIVFEDVGAIEGFKKSAALVKATWGEQVSFSFGMGLLGFVAMLPGFLLGAVMIGSGFLPLVVLGAIAMVGWIATVAAVTSALSAVFKAALYRWAHQLPVDPAFPQDAFRTAFQPR